MCNAREELYKLVERWDGEAERDPLHPFSYRAVLDEILFHADLRYVDYSPFREEGPFVSRLLAWLRNVGTAREQKALLRLVPHIVFLDGFQMRSLYRYAFKREITPWICEGTISPEQMLDPDFDVRVRHRLRQCPIYTITESFNIPLFCQSNNLVGVPKPRVLGEDPTLVAEVLPSEWTEVNGLVVLEDFVGSGKQALRILRAVRERVPGQCPILFVPLVVLDAGRKKLATELDGTNVCISPALIVDRKYCLSSEPNDGESGDFPYIRSVVQATAPRVLETLNDLDDPPSDPYGYKDLGSLVVTCHNSPNNTLPLIHHRAPAWEPLFRRLHHSKPDG